MKIIVNEEYYSMSKKGDKYGDTFYNISFELSYGTHSESKKCHPFWGESKFSYNFSSENLVVKNKISDAQIEYLFMDNNKLKYVSGTKTKDVFIKQIIEQLFISIE